MPLTRIPVHAFPECQDSWSQLDSSIQNLTLDVALEAWSNPQSDFGDLITPKSLTTLETKGVLFQEDGSWEFELFQMLYFVQAINVIEKESLGSQPTDELIKGIDKMLRAVESQSFERIKEHRILVSFILAQLVNGCGRSDILDPIDSLRISQFSFWQLYEAISDALPILELDPEALAQTFKKLTSREEGSAALGKLYSAATYLGRFRPVLAFNLVELFAAAKDPAPAIFLERLLIGIAGSSPENFDVVVARCEAWMNSDETALCQSAIGCCRNLILSGKLETDWLLSRARSLVSRPSDELRYTLAVSVAVLGASLEACAPECLEILTILDATDSRDHVVNGIAGALSFERTEHALNFAISCLPLLTDIPLENKETIKRICDMLYPLAHYSPEDVWNFLGHWIVAHEQPQDPIVGHDMFLLTIQALQQNDLIGSQRTLTLWFSSPDLRLVEQARLTIQELGIHDFASDEIGAMSVQRIRYITEKLLVGLADGIQLFWLLYSILKNTTRAEDLESYFTRVLAYLVWSYPGTARQFLDAALNDKDSSISSRLLRGAREHLEEYQTQLSGLFIPELSPSKRRTEKYHKFEIKRMRLVQEARQNDGRFPLQRLLHRVMVSRGNRTFHMNVFQPDERLRRTFTEPQGFGHFSSSSELPKGEVLDPEGEAWSRLKRLNYTLGDFQEDE